LPLELDKNGDPRVNEKLTKDLLKELIKMEK
jgi:hypothetical protein